MNFPVRARLKNNDPINLNIKIEGWIYFDLVYLTPTIRNLIDLETMQENIHLYASNNKELYVGDIVLYPNDYPQTEVEPGEPYNDFAVIVYDPLYGCFSAEIKVSRQKSKIGWKVPLVTMLEEFDKIECIGNIYDNPELLNG